MAKVNRNITLFMVALLMFSAGCQEQLSSDKSITAFSFSAILNSAALSSDVTGVIDETSRTITLTVPTATDLTSLRATFTTTGVSVKVNDTLQISGITPNDFSAGVTYTVTAVDTSTQDYVVTVNQSQAEIVTGIAEAVVTHVSNEGAFTYQQDLGTTEKDVYFVFTNTTTSTVNEASTVSSAMGQIPNDMDLSTYTMELPMDIVEYAKAHGIGLRSTPEIAAFNANPPEMIEKDSMPMNVMGPPPSARYSYTVGVSTHDFDEQIDYYTISATLRDSTTDGTVTVYLWVDNDAWDPSDDAGCVYSYCMGPTEIAAFRQAFLQSGSDNDIYDWATNIVGNPWGSHSFGNLIDNTTDIHILFYDIEDDSSTSGGILGYFWSGDTYSTGVSGSNQRLLFYMDSLLSAVPEGGTWEMTDFWPSEMISTLAHEFQHMIHFYQKAVLRAGSNSETWLDEMCAMATEDFLAGKMGVNGPRGVAYGDGTAGSASNTTGRFTDYIAYSDYSLISWGNNLYNYGLTYSFGSYLARNYGGAELFKNVVQSDQTDYQAVENAVETTTGSSVTFGDLIRRWGAAVLLSDSTSAPEYYRYNTGAFSSSTLNSLTYNLGSINAFNYYDGTYTGPKIYSPSLPSSHQSASTTFFEVGTDLTDNLSKTVYVPSGVKLSVVLKDSN